MSDERRAAVPDERERSREDAARVERQLATAQQITHIGSWEWELSSNAVTWSDELYRIYGLEPQSCDITLEGFLSRLHPEDRWRVREQIAQAIARGSRFAHEERIVRPDGSIRVLDTVGEAVRSPDGRLLGLIGTCRDVTDERERDEKVKLYADIVQNVQIALTVWKVDATSPEQSTLLACNPAAERATAVPLGARSGSALGELFEPDVTAETAELLSRVAREQRVHELPCFHFGPRPRAASFSAKAFPLPGGCVGLAWEDISRQVRARALQASEQRVLEVVASGAPLDEALEGLVSLIEEQAPSTVASILLLDPTGKRLHFGASRGLPAEYNRAIDGAVIGPNEGSCGTAAFRREAVFVRDIATDPRWASYRDLALGFGLRACWSMPIMTSDERVLGTFALYYQEPRDPNPDEVELIERATHLAGIAIQRKELDDQLRALSAHVEAVREEERTNVAREIHDELGQALTALKMDVAWLARRLRSAGASAPELDDKLRGMSGLTDEIIDQVRRISAELRPGVLDDLGLAAAIEWQAQDFERRTGATHVVRSNLGERRLDRALSTAVFRIFQEALTNVARHAEASRVEVSLQQTDGQLRLEVRDDGKGISKEALSRASSLGLLGIRERARRLGGALSIEGAPGQGTRLLLDVPLAPEGAAS